MTYTAEEFDLIALERHARAAAVAGTAASECVGDLGGRRAHASGQPLEDGDERGAMRLASGQPAQHGRESPMDRRADAASDRGAGAAGNGSTPPGEPDGVECA